MHREKRNAYGILVGKPEGKCQQEDLDVGGRIILIWILEIQDGVVWTGFIWLRIRDQGKGVVNTVMNLRVP
jgi:hypothetical protein